MVYLIFHLGLGFELTFAGGSSGFVFRSYLLANFDQVSGQIWKSDEQSDQALRVSFPLPQELGRLDIYSASYGKNTDDCSRNPNAKEMFL